MDDTIELEFLPDGRMRTVYKDDRHDLYKALGKVSVHRASNVEWEKGPSEEGWTVRAAHDPNLAIRAIIKDGAYRRVVSRTGDLLYYLTREAALEVELMHFWELLPELPKKREGSELVVYMNEREFKELLEYSHTLPTGTEIGKKWKRRVPPDGPGGTWFLGEYVEDVEPYKSQGSVGIKWSVIEVRESICFGCKLWQGRCSHWSSITEPIPQPRCLGFVAGRSS